MKFKKFYLLLYCYFLKNDEKEKIETTFKTKKNL